MWEHQKLWSMSIYGHTTRASILRSLRNNAYSAGNVRCFVPLQIHCLTPCTEVHTYSNSMMHLLCIQKWEEPWEMLLLRRRKDKGELQAVRTFRSREMEEPSTTAHRKREGLTSPVWKGKQRSS